MRIPRILLYIQCVTHVTSYHNRIAFSQLPPTNVPFTLLSQSYVDMLIISRSKLLLTDDVFHILFKISFHCRLLRDDSCNAVV